MQLRSVPGQFLPVFARAGGTLPRERRPCYNPFIMALNSALLSVAAEAALLFVLSRILFIEVVSAFADHRGKGFLLGVLRLPGNFIHELSHAIGFLICGYRIKRLLLCVFDREGRGFCTPGPAWAPFAFPQLAVGLAALMPLLLGSLALVLAARGLGIVTPTLGLGHESIIEGVWQQSLRLLHHLDWHHWQTYAFLYLALSIGAELSPSSTDLRHALPTVLVLTLGVWLFFFGLDHAPHLHHYRDSLKAGLIAGLGHLGAILTPSLILTATAAVVGLLPGLLLQSLRKHP